MFNVKHFNTWFDKNYDINSNGKIQVSSKVSTYHPIATVYTKYIEALEQAALDTEVSKQEVTDVLTQRIKDKMNEAANDNATQYITPFEFLDEFIEKNRDKFSFNENWTMIIQKGEVTNHSITIDDICQYAIAYNENVTCYKLTADSIRRAFFTTKLDKFVQSTDKLAKKVTYDASCISKLDESIEFFYNWWQIKEDKDIFFTLMKQWMWQVKRYLFDKKVTYHIWLNFRGATGLGKTIWIELLCKPFSEVYSQTQVDVLLDSSREIKKLTDNYILNFDEIAIHNNKANYTDVVSAADMAIIKQLLTASVFETRIMGGQTQMKAARTFSVISSSNEHLYDTFYDASTMRRYFEFICQVTKITDFTKLNDVLKDVEEIWKGIDENNDAGYFDPNSDVGRKIAAIQATYYPTNTTVYQWLEEANKLQLLDFDSLDGVSAEETVYGKYLDWCSRENVKHKTRRNFYDALAHYDKELVDRIMSADKNKSKKEAKPDFYSKMTPNINYDRS
jgi:hypothetical protein